MIESIRDGVIERHEKPMPKNYWLRNKKTHLDLKHDLPFAMERQLEDQRFQIENNRNPQLYKLYPHDKLRSDVISSQKGAVRSVAVKANVINKIVREVSGVHNYTIVPPPKAKYSLESEKDLVKKEFMDPSTNPRVKVYANEAKLKPKVCSFGHRPRSASRTFHPSTMKFKLRHGEVVSANPSDGSNGNKSRVGLPVAVLAKVLKAPRLYRPGEEMQEIEEQDRAEMERQQQQQQQAQTSKHFLHSYDSNSVENNNSYGNNEQKDYSDLFFSKEEEKEIFTVGQASHRSWDGNTSIASMDSKRKNMKKNNKNKKLDPVSNSS